MTEPGETSHASLGPNGEPMVTDSGYVQTAKRRITVIRNSKAEDVEEPTSSDLQNALGRGVRQCTLRVENLRNRIYFVELEDGSRIIAKQIVMGTEGMLRYQFAQLDELVRLQIPQLRIPKGLALLPEKRVLVMEFTPGETVEGLAAAFAPDAIRACELTGMVLARMQLARTESISLMPVDLLARDLAAAPWRLTRHESELLQDSLQRLSRASVRLGQLYYDFKPANVLFEGAQLSLVDPPDTFWRGVHLWDYTCFYTSLRRQSWRVALRRPYEHHRRAFMRQTVEAFVRGYCGSFAEPHPAPELFMLAVRLFELQRNAVVTTMEKANLHLAAPKMAISIAQRAAGFLAHQLNPSLLAMEKRWLFRQLGKELSHLK